MPNVTELKVAVIEAARTLPEPLPLTAAVALADQVAARLAVTPEPLSRAERNATILREWNGRNLNELMRKYQVGRTTVYRVIGKT